MNLRCLFIMVQLNKCVCVALFCNGYIVVMGVCLRQFGLNMNVGCDICLLSWARVGRAAMGSVISE